MVRRDKLAADSASISLCLESWSSAFISFDQDSGVESQATFSFIVYAGDCNFSSFLVILLCVCLGDVITFPSLRDVDVVSPL